MSRIDKWMPLYVGDYLSDTGHLTLEQSGAYLHLLMHQWRRGAVPPDGASLAAICRVTEGRFVRSIGPAVLPFFETTDAGLRQKRLHRERENSLMVSEKRAIAAKAKKPPQTSENNDMTEAIAHTKAPAIVVAKQGIRGRAVQSQLQRTEESKEERPFATLTPSFSPAPGFDDFWMNYPRKVGKDAARKAWASAAKRADPSEILAGLSKAVWPADPQFVPHPSTWLNGGRWQDDPMAAAPRNLTEQEKTLRVLGLDGIDDDQQELGGFLQ